MVKVVLDASSDGPIGISVLLFAVRDTERFNRDQSTSATGARHLVAGENPIAPKPDRLCEASMLSEASAKLRTMRQ
jgi:hypothetical protein